MTKKSQFTYDEIFQRNIGVFTEKEQEKIKNLKVAIAGAGGLGTFHWLDFYIKISFLE